MFSGLVYGEPLETSEIVMREIFGEQEIQLLYRVALEMGHVDRGGQQFHSLTGVRQGVNVIQIDDDDDDNMLDVTYVGGPSQQGVASVGKFIHHLHLKYTSKL